LKRKIISTFIPALVVLIIMMSSLSARGNQLADLHDPGYIQRIVSCTTMAASGRVVMGGLPGRMIYYYQAPDKLRLDINLNVFRLTQIYDGMQGWLIDQNGQLSELTGHDLAKIKNSLYLTSFAYLWDNRPAGGPEFLADSTIDGIAYRIFKAYPDGGDSLKLFFNMKYKRVDISAEYIDELEVFTYQKDFRDIEGLEVAFRNEFVSPVPEMNITTELDSLDLNLPLVDTLFAVRIKNADDYFFPAGNDSVVIAIEYYDGHIYLRPLVNGDTTALFILDSGAGINILDQAYASKLALESSGEFAAKGISGYDGIGLVKIDSLSLGGIILRGQTAAVMDLVGLGLKGKSGPLCGLLGYDFLSRFPLRLDYRQEKITIYNPDTYTGGGLNQGIPFDLLLKIPVLGGKVGEYPANFLLDLGNPLSIILHPEFVERHNLKDKLSDIKTLGQGIGGVGGPMALTAAVASEIWIGPWPFKNVPVMLSEGQKGVSGSIEIAGGIGNLFLESFSVVLDYKNRMVYIIPPEN